MNDLGVGLGLGLGLGARRGLAFRLMNPFVGGFLVCVNGFFLNGSMRV
jgi:hypothetical protein